MPTTYEILATTTIGSGLNTFTFSSISNAYTDLRLVCNLQLNATASIRMRCNGDTGTNYVWQNLHIENSSATASATIYEGSQDFTWYGFQASGVPGILTVDFLSYASSINKPYLWERGVHPGSTSAGQNSKSVGCSTYTSGAAISSITIFTNSTFVNGGTATLFGILKA